MNMEQEIREAAKRLWTTYRLYYEVSKTEHAGVDGREYADQCTKDYIDYLIEMRKTFPSWTDMPSMINNQVRILKGLIECYDTRGLMNKPVVSNKTRWSL